MGYIGLRTQACQGNYLGTYLPSGYLSTRLSTPAFTWPSSFVSCPSPSLFSSWPPSLPVLFTLCVFLPYPYCTLLFLRFPRAPLPGTNMAVFVDLEDEDVDLPQQGHNGIKPVWNGLAPSEPSTFGVVEKGTYCGVSAENIDREEAAHESAVDESPNSMTVALGCYP